ncbi:hypothetical protein ACFSMW_14755 [Virgibacillus halophilus]|uniref:Uncharacterized protein n=1 Tax=Tigheibacillus halophilus TaxID=361280 RepID=A0ABU5CCT5_9BACI|nr:hypothetical protein [Virgibacillus halophilus]
MCKTCHGEGGLTVQQSWGVEFVPCPDSHCGFDKVKAWQETLATLDRLMAKVKVTA